MKQLLLLLCVALITVFTSCQRPQAQLNHDRATPLGIIPQPQHITSKTGNFAFDLSTPIFIGNDSLASVAQTFIQQIKRGQSAILTQQRPTNQPFISLEIDKRIPNVEGYSLDVSPEEIQVKGRTSAGIFYGLQSLYQLMPVGKNLTYWKIPAAHIIDEPRFSYRGMMLDVGRHMTSVDSVKRFIDLMAMHKMNTFHWHLTEDQGWRIEIKKYPKLTEIGSKRTGTRVGHARNRPIVYDDAPYGGYYTQEQIKEVVAYASAHFITVIPEIELPGHASAALAAYPQFGCKDTSNYTYEVIRDWGIFDNVFSPKEETFAFWEDVLTEVMALFPSKYIHIGGDECPTTHWEESEFCQALMKKEGMTEAREIQGYINRRVEKFLNANGRTLVGWDEILEGGIAPNAVVMSWRGVSGGIEAAKHGHDVVMSPTTHCYFDYYQADPKHEPLAIGGLLNVKKVYSYDPVPDELTEQEATHILGTQANLWTEYVPTFKHAEYMLYPRACAISEVAWSSKENRDWKDFSLRLGDQMTRLEDMGVNVAKHYFHIETAVIPDTQAHNLKIVLETAAMQDKIYYTLDGTEPTTQASLYTQPIILKSSKTIKAATFRKGERMGEIMTQDFMVHKAIARPLLFKHTPSSKYNANPWVLTNGTRGDDFFNDTWYGFDETDIEATVDLGSLTTIQQVTAGFLSTTSDWIFPPQTVKFMISQDGKTFETVAIKHDSTAISETQKPIERKDHIASLDGQEARYIRIVAANTIIPQWHGGAGSGSWLFMDEIIVE